MLMTANVRTALAVCSFVADLIQAVQARGDIWPVSCDGTVILHKYGYMKICAKSESALRKVGYVSFKHMVVWI